MNWFRLIDSHSLFRIRAMHGACDHEVLGHGAIRYCCQALHVPRGNVRVADCRLGEGHQILRAGADRV